MRVDLPPPLRVGESLMQKVRLSSFKSGSMDSGNQVIPNNKAED
jgi:hypothetical protein